MSNILIATLGGVIALIFWGASDWMAARSSKKYDVFKVNLALQIPGILMLGGIFLLSGYKLPDLATIATIFSVEVFFTLAYLSFIKALSTGSVGIVVPLANTYPILTLFLSITLLSVVFTQLQIVAMLVVIAGAIILAYEKNTKKIPLRKLYKETFFALGAAIAWGIGFFIVNTVVDKQPWQVILGIMGVSMFVLALIICAFAYRKKTIKVILDSRKNKWGLWSGVMLSLGSIGIYFGAEKSGSILIPAVIASAAPLFASLLGAVIDKEKVGVLKRAGAVVVIGGVILLNLP